MHAVRFDWNSTRQLTVAGLLAAVFVPSAVGFLGFHFVEPRMVAAGFPAIVVWPIVASVMLAGLLLIAVVLLHCEARALGITFADRACLAKVPPRGWMLYFVIAAGAAASAGLQPLVLKMLHAADFTVPGYMPYFLNPAIDPRTASGAVVSPGYPLEGKFLLIPLMMFALLLNVLVEEMYFRAWMLPKLARFGAWSWAVNGTLFAFYHTFQLWLWPMILIPSLCFAFMVYHARSIQPSLAFHFVLNFVFAIGGFIALILGMGTST